MFSANVCCNTLLKRVLAVTLAIMVFVIVGIIRGDLLPVNADELNGTASVVVGHQDFMLALHGMNFMFPLLGMVIIISSTIGLVLLSRSTQRSCVRIANELTRLS